MGSGNIVGRDPFGRRTHVVLRFAALAAIAVAVLLFYRVQDTSDTLETPMPMTVDAPLAAAAAGIDDLPPLFADTPPADGADRLPEEQLTQLDRPQLIGIAGRLPDDVEILLRRSDGSSVSLRIGGRIDGYVLKSVAADRAVFVKNGREVLLRMPGA